MSRSLGDAPNRWQREMRERLMVLLGSRGRSADLVDPRSGRRGPAMMSDPDNLINAVAELRLQIAPCNRALVLVRIIGFP